MFWNVFKSANKALNKAANKVEQAIEAKRDPGIYEDWKPAKPKTSPVAAVAAKPMPPAPAPAKPAPVATAAGSRPGAKPLFKESNGNVDASRLHNALITGKITQQEYDEKMAALKKRYTPA